MNTTYSFSKMWQSHTNTWLASLGDAFVLLKKKRDGSEELRESE